MTKKKITATANPGYAKAMHGLRSSSAAQRHTPKPRKGARTQRRRDAIRDQHKTQD